jgi:hypothetical protein
MARGPEWTTQQDQALQAFVKQHPIAGRAPRGYWEGAAKKTKRTGPQCSMRFHYLVQTGAVKRLKPTKSPKIAKPAKKRALRVAAPTERVKPTKARVRKKAQAQKSAPRGLGHFEFSPDVLEAVSRIEGLLQQILVAVKTSNHALDANLTKMIGERTGAQA